MKRKLLIFSTTLFALWSTNTDAQQWKSLITETFESGTPARSTNPAADILPGTTDYNIAPSTGGFAGVSDGNYTVGKTPAAPLASSGVWIVGARDHTGNTNGYMMTINANPARQGEANGTYYLYSTANFDVPGATYAIDFWGANILLPNLTNIFKPGLVGLSIRDAINTGGTQYATASYTLARGSSSTALPWQNESLQFSLPITYAGARLYFNFFNRDTDPSTNGNDFVLDDIRIRMRVVTFSGTVFNDYNGNGVVNAGEPAINGITTPLYAYITKTDGSIVSKVQVNANGTYSFATDQGLPYSASNIGLKVVISSSSLTPGTETTTTSSIPGYKVVSESGNNPAAVTSGPVDGIMSVTKSDIDITNVNFGINEIPTAVSNTLPGVPNPGGSSSAPVSSTSFKGNEVTGGQISSIKIKSFPSNAESITINGITYLATDLVWAAGGVVIPANASGNSTQSIGVNPVNGAVSVVIPYTATDNLGLESTIANVTVPFIDLTISGTAHSDGNGGTVDGPGTNVIGGNTLYAILTDAVGTAVIGSVPVQPDGTYIFGTGNGVTANTNFQVVIANTPGVPGQAVPSTALTDAVNTAEGNAGTAGDGSPDGKIAVSVATTNVTDKDFGIDQLSTASPVNITIPQPNVGTEIVLNGTSGNPVPDASDPEDGNLGAGKTIIINSVPANAQLYYNNVLVTNGLKIDNFDPDALKIVLTSATLGAVSTSFQFSYEDAAGFPGNPAEYKVSWDKPLPVTLIYFKGSIRESVAVLNWATSQEINADKFDIERSPDSKTWSKMDEVDAAGNNNAERLYEYTDKLPLSGLNYYRLKMIDLDETYAYSRVISLNMVTAPEIVVYPNPESEKLYLKGIQSSDVKSVQLTNLKGLVVYKSNSVSSGIDISKFTPGLYLLKLTDTNNRITVFKVVKP